MSLPADLHRELAGIVYSLELADELISNSMVPLLRASTSAMEIRAKNQPATGAEALDAIADDFFMSAGKLREALRKAAAVVRQDVSFPPPAGL